MANVDFPHGFSPIRHLMGAPFNCNEYTKAVGYATGIFINDVCIRVADGSIEAIATPGTEIPLGVSLNHRGPSLATTHLLIDDPYMIYEAQSEGAGLAAADFGMNTNVSVGAGNATSGISGHEIEDGAENTTNTLDLHLMKLFPHPENEAGTNMRIEVMFNTHRHGHQTVGV